MAEFARLMDEQLHEHPEMWWNWLDKRWTRILRSRSRSEDLRGPAAAATHLELKEASAPVYRTSVRDPRSC
jgi:hypothetical protein